MKKTLLASAFALLVTTAFTTAEEGKPVMAEATAMAEPAKTEMMAKEAAAMPAEMKKDMPMDGKMMDKKDMHHEMKHEMKKPMAHKHSKGMMKHKTANMATDALNKQTGPYVAPMPMMMDKKDMPMKDGMMMDKKDMPMNDGMMMDKKDMPMNGDMAKKDMPMNDGMMMDKKDMPKDGMMEKGMAAPAA